MEYNEYKLLLSNKTKITHIFLTNPAQNAFSSILEGIQSLVCFLKFSIVYFINSKEKSIKMEGGQVGLKS